MTEEKRKDFKNIIAFIDESKYDDAIEELNKLLLCDDVEKKEYANYLLGYINTCWDYSEKDEKEAKRRLYDNLNSKYPHPYAFILYSNIIEDKNIAENYIRKGIQLFPNDHRLYDKLFYLSNNKDEIISQVEEKGFTDISLLGEIISHLFYAEKWEKIECFIVRIKENNELNEFEKLYLMLIKAYVLLLRKEANYEEAENILKTIIEEDTDNNFLYAHYMGIIYAYIKNGDYKKATDYFDKLPVSNSICDFDDCPWPLNINLVFEKTYKLIFECIVLMFSKDQMRKSKASALYALYLYSSSIMFDVHRYGKTEVTALSRYLKNQFNIDVAIALYNMRCHFKQYREAYDILWMFLREYENPENKTLFFSEITEEATETEILHIANITLLNLKKDDYDKNLFLSCIFSELIEKLYELKAYKQVQLIADYFTIDQIISSDCAFECAYAYGSTDEKRSADIYEKLIQKEPKNSSAINNLGVQYEHKNELFGALECYEKALSITPNDEIQQNNLKRIQELILEQTEEEFSQIRDSISLESLNEIGYTIELCQKIISIQDSDMRNVLQRDLRECAVAVISSQDKSATIMCGSIMEALLMQKIKEQGIIKYNISEISKSKHATNYPLTDMGLNELLFVAERLNIIVKNSYHLGHYIRDYRNVVHPAKEIRMKEEITHDNVLTMWSVLRKLIVEIL